MVVLPAINVLASYISCMKHKYNPNMTLLYI